MWTFVGTLDGETRTAKVGVPWSLYGGYAVTLGTSDASGVFGVDTQQVGPDRRSTKKEVLPISYSCDDWLRDASTASTLTFLSPSGASDAVVNTGTGSLKYTFNEVGEWTVTLTMADSTVRTAKITIKTIGFILSIH